MADKAPEHELPLDLASPLALVEPLSLLPEAERGNTPRPSRARLAFVSGVAAVQKKQFEQGFKQLTTAVQEAEKDKKDKETLATTLTGLGYLCACVQQYDKAAICYQRALKFWEKIHGEHLSKLVPFMIDTSTVLQHASKFDEAFTVLESAKTALAGEKGESDAEVQGLVAGLATIRMKQKKPEEANKLFQSALEVLESGNNPQEVQLLQLMISLQESEKKTEEVTKLKEKLKVASEKHKIPVQ